MQVSVTGRSAISQGILETGMCIVSWRLSDLVGTAYESTGVAFRQIACGYGITVPLRGSMGASSSLRYENPSLHKPQQIEDFPIPDSPANSNPRPWSAKAAACTKYKSGLSACNAMVISFSIQYARSSRSVQVTARPGRSMLHRRIRRSKRTAISSAGAATELRIRSPEYRAVTTAPACTSSQEMRTHLSKTSSCSISTGDYRTGTFTLAERLGIQGLGIHRIPQ